MPYTIEGPLDPDESYFDTSYHIQQVNNGYILDIEGCVFVFNTTIRMFKFLEKVFKEEKTNDQCRSKRKVAERRRV